MGFKKDVEQVKKDIERKISDNIYKSANLTILQNAENEKEKINLARVVNSSNPCPYCASHAKVFRVKDKESSHASEFHSGCKCQLVGSSRTIKKKKGGIKYIKQRERLTAGEIQAVDVFMALGYQVVTLEEDSSKPKNIDFLVNGKLIEHKNVTSRSSLISQIGRSRKKFYILKIRKHRHVITFLGEDVDRSMVINYCQKNKRNYETFYLIFGEKMIII